MVEDLRF